jgi:hypothetical protein
MPTTAHFPNDEGAVMTVMIGVDPHKGSHTAVVVDETEQALGELKVRSGPSQLERLLAWAQRFPARSWAVENATGLGYLLAQQLVGAGERVIDVQPKLGARVRLLDNHSVNKNDPHDARSVAIAALRSRAPVEVRAEDHSAVASCGPSASVTSPGPATRWRAGCTRCCASSCPAGYQTRSTPQRRTNCWLP